MSRYPSFVWSLAAAVLMACCQGPSILKPGHDYLEWEAYAGAKDGNRYSAGDQITVENVAQLEVAWTFSTADKDPRNRSQIQCNPIVVDGVLYGLSPKSKLFALDAANGTLKWMFDPERVDTAEAERSFYQVIRGVMYWEDSTQADKRIFYGSGPYVYAVNANNGQLIQSFGKDGKINLRENLDREGLENAFLASTTPGVIYKDLMILGTRVSDAPGHIRAYDVRTGERKWIFHTIPHPGELGYDTWENPDAWKTFGKVNSWAGMALDEKRGIVYIPTASPSIEYYGANRKGMNWFGNSLIALDANTGQYIWHYQFVHHDLWDRDLPANPNLVTLKIGGKEVDAITQITKHGYVFVFDRVSGKPLFPINEVPVPTDGLPGEKPWPTQPIPVKPEPFARQQFEPEDVSDLTPETHAYLMERYLKIKHRAKFSPPSMEGTWVFPGFDGGGEWGGAAIDLESQIMYVNSSELPWSQVMAEIPVGANNGNGTVPEVGRSVYLTNCATCHGASLVSPDPSFPTLKGIGRRLKEPEIHQVIDNGRNMMPAFKHLNEGEKRALVKYLLAPDQAANMDTSTSQKASDRESPPPQPSTAPQTPYVSTGLVRFLDQNGYPGIKPPWGTLNAIDLNKGEVLWKVTLGEHPELTARGIPPTGTENYGGPLVTKGGIVFIAATQDRKIRAFDKRTGNVLWQHDLPAAGFATPASYSVNGRQYVVIACGGGKVGLPSGDTYICFALPRHL
ncbi:outer membrane protein assembly factor BamB family protein [Parapedobacter koreensis]|uniref:Quinoprotein glucose dehydrogenase n=1 Tax=Parapedobacter koreensis TaxID=332977 RepID=A0A1H7S0F5_9SPHI|nr:PQQ-binding-like beta-propeller repeat protein [Parapedobacter koreensis]SEL65982.1 quinoprotein glucose dehydrogenase [Parapedobacter koreensis]